MAKKQTPKKEEVVTRKNKNKNGKKITPTRQETMTREKEMEPIQQYSTTVEYKKMQILR